jgi:hypothetical protein
VLYQLSYTPTERKPLSYNSLLFQERCRPNGKDGIRGDFRPSGITNSIAAFEQRFSSKSPASTEKITAQSKHEPGEKPVVQRDMAANITALAQ